MNSVVHDSEATKVWEQPLTTADMRARAAEWSLADDSRLLAYLEVFTRSITSRTCEIQKQLEGLVHETMISGVKVHNVINDFSHLNSLQFVENRVYDEEEVKADSRDAQQPVSKEDEEGSLMGQVSEAFRLGVEVLHSSLEVVDLRQDSEEEDDDDSDAEEAHRAGEPLLRPLDPYLARPLPTLIGSDQFLKDDYVGLGELLSEDEGDEKSSLGEYDSNKSEGDSSDMDGTKDPVIDNTMATYMQQEFGDTLSDSTEKHLAGDTEELHSDHSSDDEVSSKKRKTSAVLEEDSAKVQDAMETSQHEECASPFSRRSGFFSGSGKLFDDDDEEGDLFRDGSTSMPPDKVGTDLFGSVSQEATSTGGGLNPAPSVGTKDVSASSIDQNATATQKASASGLFDEEDYSDLWTSTPARGCPGLLQSEDQRDKPKHVLFDDDEDDLFSATNAAAKSATKPAGKSLFSDDEEDIFVDTALPVTKDQQSKPFLSNPDVARKSQPSSRGIFLFEDEDDGSENSCPAAATVLEKPEDGTSGRHEPISMFAAEEDVDEDLFAVHTPPAHLADSQSSHSVQSASWSMGSKGDAEPTSVVEAVPEEPVSKPRSGSCFIFDQEKDIFESSEGNVDVDLFAPTKHPAPKKPPPGAVSLFGGSSLFGDELKSRLGRASSGQGLPTSGMPDAFKEAEQHQAPLRDTKVVSVSFDEPADQNKTLISATKGRAKVNTKRRPPSRRKLQEDARFDGESQDSPTDGALFPSSHANVRVVTHLDAEQTVNQSSLKPALMVAKSPSTEEEDLFAVNSLQPVAAEAKHRLRQASSQVPFGKSIFDDDTEEDLFASCVESPDTSGHEHSDAIFAAGDTVPHWSGDHLPKNSAANLDAKALPASEKVSTNIFDDDDGDDIFASKPGMSYQAKQNTLFSDDTDDIFSAIPTSVAAVEKKGSQPAARKSLPRTRDFKDPLLGDISD
uniref:WASH complex subunit FAM21 n=1 Tax=Rhipicephalus zambeziensis TaxID=60191 RepID=A0A224Z3P5_9ACAR